MSDRRDEWRPAWDLAHACLDRITELAALVEAKQKLVDEMEEREDYSANFDSSQAELEKLEAELSNLDKKVGIEDRYDPDGLTVAKIRDLMRQYEQILMIGGSNRPGHVPTIKAEIQGPLEPLLESFGLPIYF